VRHLTPGTLWAATSAGALFITKNAAANRHGGDVHASRLAGGERSEPFHHRHLRRSVESEPCLGDVLGIQHDDRIDGSWSRLRGHVQSGRPVRDLVDRSYDLADLPVTDVAFDDPTGDLYVSTDFGVMRLEAGETSWEVAGDGLPVVETPGLTIVTHRAGCMRRRTAWGCGI
jgi:hypothetical protein